MSENTKREANPTLFKDVNFYVSGEIDDSVVQTLENSGATHSKYFSDFVSHLLCGNDPEENDLIDASDVYEIPAILPQWVEMCIKLNKLVDTKPYAYGRQRIFAGQTFCLSKPGKDLENLWGLITYHGGTVQLNLDNKCDYLVTTNTSGAKYDKAYHLGSDILTIVTPDWVVESIKAKQLAPHDVYHPKLINWPKPAPSTTTITGFEEESKENASKSDVVADSTQALLDKLKQRMFLSNQPPPLANKDDVVPPNVTAPMQNALTNQQILQKIQTAKNHNFGQLGQMLSQPQQQLPQQNVMGQQQQQNVMTQQQQQVSGMAPQVQQQLLLNPQQQTQNLRGLVHHAPQQQQQPQQQQTQFLQQQNQGLNRLLGPQQQRPMQQQVRAPLNPQQIQQQQLLQQRINQVQMLQQQQRLLAQQGQQLGPQQSVQQQQIGAQPQQQQQLLQNQLSQNNQQLVNRIQQQSGQKLAPHQITQLLQQRQQQLAQQQQQQQQGHQPQQLLPNQQQLLQNRILQQQQQQQQQGQQLNQQLIQTPMNQQQQQSTIDQLSQQQKINQIRQNLMAPMNQPSLPSQFNQQQPMEVSDDQQQQGQINNINQQMGSNQQIINNDQSLGQMSLNQMLGQQHQQVQQQQMPNQQQIQQQLVTQSNQGQQSLQQNQMLKNNINIGQQVNQQQQRMGIQPQQQFMQQNQQETGINQQNLNMPQQLGQQQVMQQPQQHLNQQQAPQQQVLGQQQVINQQLGPQQQQLLFNQGQQVVRPQQQQIWQQQQGQQGPQIRQQLNIMQTGPRIQWTSGQQQPNVPQRQFIQLDAQTHHQLQKMPPEQQALFVQRLKQKQLLLQKQAQQRGQMSNTFLIRGSVPPGLSPQQQVAWLQQQAKQQGVVIPNNLQQQTITSTTLNVPPGGAPTQVQQITPGLSPIQQQTPLTEQQQQLQLRQFRLQQLQREQAQKQGPIAQPQPALIRPTDPNTIAADPAQQNPLQPKTKTALANMLSIRLQSGGTSGPQVPGQEAPIAEPSAAGTLRLMTAQHNAALNPNTRGLDLLALQQRRVINGPNGEIIRPPGPVGVGPVATPTEPPKLQFSPRANVVPLQHRPGPFYGHNPNLKLPPDLYLLGCIFVVVEIEDYLNESLPGWEKKIEKHGGEVEKQYCSRVTHVLCETQRHGVVMQALRDCKRCVTVYWLSDIMKRKQVLPPWVALHIPNIYLDTTPASKHLVSISGFTGNERNRVKHMISYTGAKFTSYFSKHNTLLISAKNEGPKFAHAKKWGIPVVNVQWLTEIMLGNFMAMNQTENIIYQQFQQPPNFSFDPKLVPNLMLAWKMAINISQESYERVKRSASPVILPKSPKKPKLENIVDENANIDNSHANPCYKILFSRSPNLQKLKEVVKTLGGSVAQSHVDCTHLVMPTLARSNKLLFAICRGIPILPEQWLFDSQSQNKFLDENNYSLDTKHFNSEFKCDLSQTLSIKNRNALLQGKYFWVTPSVFPSKKVITELIQNCGGFVEKNRRTSAQIDSVNITSPYSYIIITHEKDIHLVADLLRNKKDKIKIICNAELIFSAILKQTFEVEPYTVKIL